MEEQSQEWTLDHNHGPSPDCVLESSEKLLKFSMPKLQPRPIVPETWEWDPDISIFFFFTRKECPLLYSTGNSTSLYSRN